MLTSLEFLTSGLGMGIVSVASLALALFSAYAGYRDLKNTIKKKNREKEKAEQAAAEAKETELQKAEQQQKEMEQLRQRISELEEQVEQAKETETAGASYTSGMDRGEMADTGPLPVLETRRALRRASTIAGYERNKALTVYTGEKIAVVCSTSKQGHHISGTPGIHVGENSQKVRLK